MKCFDTYYQYYNVFQPLIKTPAPQNPGPKIVIPCYNEPDIEPSIRALFNSRRAKKITEIILVINSSECDTPEVLNQNLLCEQKALGLKSELDDDNLKLEIINIKNLPAKHAGVGFARKIGMDEAVRRFDAANIKEGVIINFDADSLCNNDYIAAIDDFFMKNKKLRACSIRFLHPCTGNDFSQETYSAITDYELYLRYYRTACQYTGFPYAFHTLGSSFAVRADVYAAAGGMNRRKAGEDFYFLQKIIPGGNYKNLNKAVVYPSPRKSDRVPFGTGAAITAILNSEHSTLKVYDFSAFAMLKELFLQVDKLYDGNNLVVSNPMTDFLNINNFDDALVNMRQNSSKIKSFTKRFFTWFDAFRLLKFLNFIHTDKPVINKIDINIAAIDLLKELGYINLPGNNKDLLEFYRTNVDKDE